MISSEITGTDVDVYVFPQEFPTQSLHFFRPSRTPHEGLPIRLQF